MIRTPAGLALIPALALLFVCGDLCAAETDRDALERLEHEFNAAVLARDAAALDRLLDDDYVTGGIRVLGKSDQIELITASIPPKTQTIDSMDVRLHGDTAVVTGLATAGWATPAGAGTRTFRWVNVWIRGDEGWRAVYGQTTDVSLSSSKDGC